MTGGCEPGGGNATSESKSVCTNRHGFFPRMRMVPVGVLSLSQLGDLFSVEKKCPPELHTAGAGDAAVASVSKKAAPR